MKNEIQIGKDQTGKPFVFNLKRLLETRFLVQAASGGGKSRTLRRFAEQLFGKVPVWIIDKEDEFPSLREKFGYVFSGPGGETPTDIRSAELVCERLLKARASAIFGLYSLKDPARHEWVKLFLNALMNAPKSLWQHVIIMVDESHKFAPEKGQGESVAREAMTDLAVDGRKRGFCAGFFTQRLGKLSKNASAELLNRLIGKTVEDIDIDRAVSLMSVRRSDFHDFEYGIKRLQPGHFWALGDALSIDRTLTHIDPCLTTHPEPGAPAAAAPPPLPEKMKALLPQLADLPKEAEVKAHTEAELRAEIRKLKIELTKKPPIQVVAAPKTLPAEVKIVKVPTLKASLAKSLERVVEKLGKMAQQVADAKPLEALLREESKAVRDALAKAFAAKEAAPLSARIPSVPSFLPPRPPAKSATVMTAPKPTRKTIADSGDLEITNPQLEILQGICEWRDCGFDKVGRAPLAGWLSKKVSGSFKNDLSHLRTAGLIEYHGPQVEITSEGIKIAPAGTREVTNDALFSSVLEAAKKGPHKEILKVCHDQNGEWIARQAIAEALGKAYSGSFKNDLSRLHTAQMIEYGERRSEQSNMVRLSAWVYPQVQQLV